MKHIAIALTAVAVVLMSCAVFAQPKADAMKGMDMAKKPAAATRTQTVHRASGTVKKVDPASGLVTLAHGPVTSLNWPAMTMKFQVNNNLLFDQLAVGNKVDFEFVQGTKGYVVTAVK